MSEFDLHTEKLLIASVAQYRGLLQHAENLVIIQDSGDYSKVGEHVAKLQLLQSEASRQDEELLPLLILDLPTWEKHALYQKRLSCIKSIVELNKLLLPKIHSVMAVTSAELNKLSGGRNALAGYTTRATKKRRFFGIG